MFRYQAFAAAFKLTDATFAAPAYRALGNYKNRNSRTDFSHAYAERGKWLVSNLRDLGLLDRSGVSGLEIGTGWMHFCGVLSALAGVEHMTLYDVWDNRQFQRCKNSFGAYDWDFRDFGVPDPTRADARLQELKAAATFDEMYEALGLRYVVDKPGSLAPIAANSCDFVCSLDVLEHVRYAGLRDYIARMFDVLKPGGYSLHQVGLDDHLTHYDRGASHKQYLKYPDDVWQRRFANDIQYFNRATHDEFRDWFKDAGFEEVSIETARDIDAVASLGGRKGIAPRFRDQSDESLYAVRSFIVHRKPAR